MVWGVAIISLTLLLAPASGRAEDLAFVLQGLPAALTSITGTSVGDLYAVGGDPGDGIGPLVLHYDGAVWRRRRSGTRGDLWWITGPIGGDYYMAGENGLILQYTPERRRFTTHGTPGRELLFGIWGTSPTDLWAVGGDLSDEDDGGTVWHYDGAGWTVDPRARAARGGSLPTLYKVWGRSATDVWVVGRLGVALHFDGDKWVSVATDTTAPLFTVHGNARHVAATGGLLEGVLFELNGDRFADRTPPGAFQLNGIFFAHGASDTASAVGNAGENARRTAVGWGTRERPQTLLDFHATWIDPDAGVWAVGGDLSVSLSRGMVAYGGAAEISAEVVTDVPCPPGARAPAAGSVSWVTDVKPLLMRSGCFDAACHGGSSPASRYDLRSYEGTFGPGALADVLGVCEVVPGEPEASFLLEKLGPSARLGARMPNGRPPIERGGDEPHPNLDPGGRPQRRGSHRYEHARAQCHSHADRDAAGTAMPWRLQRRP